MKWFKKLLGRFRKKDSNKIAKIEFFVDDNGKENISYSWQDKHLVDFIQLMYNINMGHYLQSTLDLLQTHFEQEGREQEFKDFKTVFAELMKSNEGPIVDPCDVFQGPNNEGGMF